MIPYAALAWGPSHKCGPACGPSCGRMLGFPSSMGKVLQAGVRLGRPLGPCLIGQRSCAGATPSGDVLAGTWVIVAGAMSSSLSEFGR